MKARMLASLGALAASAESRPGAPAVSLPRRTIGYGELLGLLACAVHEVDWLGKTVGVAGPNSLAWLLADLALGWTGRRMVPIPVFFSQGQIAHLLRDAGVEDILWTGDGVDMPDFGGIATGCLSFEVITDLPHPTPGAERVIYTSGTTGQPKGVVHGVDQMNAVMHGLAKAVGANERDLHLSCLPFALLLEQICGIHLPLLVGGQVHLREAISAGMLNGDPGPALAALSTVGPTTMVLTPQLLAGLVAALEQTGLRPPATLRFVAVGGAPLSPDLIRHAWTLGLPVHEGYGLSECCSVVALNRPGENAPGTVGRPLAGVEVTIDKGEIVVRSPGVMAGYLHRETDHSSGIWRTGDVGEIDDHGRLTVHGRQDNVIVTTGGRNISPEWIEAMIEADPRIAHAVVMGHGAAHLTAIIWLSPAGKRWLAPIGYSALISVVAACCITAPVHARPTTVQCAGPGDEATKFFSPAGSPRRDLVERHFASLGAGTVPSLSTTRARKTG